MTGTYMEMPQQKVNFLQMKVNFLQMKVNTGPGSNTRVGFLHTTNNCPMENLIWELIQGVKLLSLVPYVAFKESSDHSISSSESSWERQKPKKSTAPWC